MKRFSLHLILIILCTVHVRAQEKVDSLDLSVKQWMSAQHIPGFAAAVVKNGKLSWYKTYGQADIAKNTPMSIDGILNIGSISKTFTTTALMQLWEKGLIDLDADVNTYLEFKVRNPKYPDKPISISQILTHTSSIADGKAYIESYNCGDPSLSLNDWIVSVLTSDGKSYNNGDCFAAWAPGEKRRYSNIAFGLLGLIVEKVAKQPFNIYCRENIFKPLGMNKTGWMISEVDTAKYIQPYAYITEENRKDILSIERLYLDHPQFKVGTFERNCLYSYPNYPDGAVRTSVRELSYYLTALLNGGELNGKRILKKETLEKMLKPRIPGDNSQGLTWRTTQFPTPSGKVTLWGHSGLDPGIQTFLYFDPVAKTGVITFQNNPADGTGEILGRIYGSRLRLP